MKAILIAAAAAVGVGGSTLAEISRRSDAPDTSKPKVVLRGVAWESSLDAALARANKENKPVLHLQMFGDLDDAFC